MRFSWYPTVPPDPNRQPPGIRHVLYEYDGPKLVLAADERERQVLGIAVDEVVEERITRWAFAPVSPAQVIHLLEGALMLREIFTAGEVFLFDFNAAGEVTSWKLDGESIPDEIFPDADATLPELDATIRDQLLTAQRRLAEEQQRLAEVVSDVGALIDAAAAGDQELVDIVGDFDPRVISTLKELFSVIHKAEATFRLVANDRTYRFDTERVRMAAERTAAEPTEEPDRAFLGTLSGYLPDGRRFEFREESSDVVIRGRIAREADLDDIRRWFDKRGVAHMRVVTVKRGGQESRAFTLLRIEPPRGAP